MSHPIDLIIQVVAVGDGIKTRGITREDVRILFVVKMQYVWIYQRLCYCLGLAVLQRLVNYDILVILVLFLNNICFFLLVVATGR